MQSDYQIKDRVKVIRRVTDDDAWDEYWDDEMDRFILSTGTVINIDLDTKSVMLDFDNSSVNWWFPFCCIEIVPVEIVVGDWVEIARIVHEEDGWDNFWVRTMDQYVGKTGVVEKISSNGYRLQFESDPSIWTFPLSSLRLIKQADNGTVVKEINSIGITPAVRRVSGWVLEDGHEDETVFYSHKQVWDLIQENAKLKADLETMVCARKDMKELALQCLKLSEGK